MEEDHIMPVWNALPIAATASADAAAAQISGVSTIIMIVLMVAVFYFFIMRPENKKKKAAEELRASLKVGDEITTIGGIVGTICAVKEKTIVMETGADRVRIEFTKWAISSKGTQSAEDTAPAEEKKAEKK